MRSTAGSVGISGRKAGEDVKVRRGRPCGPRLVGPDQPSRVAPTGYEFRRRPIFAAGFHASGPLRRAHH